MDILKILLATIAATSTMTAFSYFMSEAFNNLYKEPVFLDIVMRKLGLKPGEVPRRIAAWALHYFIGLIFVICFEVICKQTDVNVTWLTGLIYGAICGIAGMLGWMIIFRLPENPPKVQFKEYYLQLFFAHIIFGVTVVAVYKLF
ncbi:MAG TPA: hypothetical protein VGB43_02445 [Flavobacterium sp.]|jgi:hypothetical protein